MNVHKNARLTPHSRADLARRILQENQSHVAVAAAFGVSAKTVKKWVERFCAHGTAGLADRSSRPRKLRYPTPPDVVMRIGALRRLRFTAKQIAKETGAQRPPSAGC